MAFEQGYVFPSTTLTPYFALLFVTHDRLSMKKHHQIDA